MVDWKKTIGTSILSAGLVFSAFAPAASAQTASGNHLNSSQLASGILGSYEGGPFDIGLVNDDLLLPSLIKQGVIDKNASAADQQAALTQYISNRAKAASEMAGNKSAKDVRANLQTQAGLKHKAPGTKDNADNGNTSKTPKVNPGIGHGDVNPIQPEAWNGTVRHDKELVILIDFPNYSNTDLPEKDGNDPGIVLNLPSYPTEHYQNMIFGENGYSGPSGQKLISEKQFYEQQSGGSYTVDGDVYGWYHAKHDAAYYGGHSATAGNDKNPRALINEALADVAADGVNLSQYDQEDPYDLDGDGNLREPDGIIDHLVVVHSGIGEESGGGSLGGDAIWSHSWNLAGPTVIPGTAGQSKVNYWGGNQLVGYAYTVQPEDGAAGVFAHEYGHNLGLPDDYDIAYSTPYDEPVGYWSIMSAGSWGGKIAGTEPTGFNAKDKEFLQSTMPDSNWFKPATFNLDDLKGNGQFVKLDEASIKGTNADAVRVNLPDKVTNVNTPASGDYEYFSGSGNNLDNSMVTSVDLTGKTSAELNFKTWYDIEPDWDYASVQVQQGDDWVTVPGNITTTTSPNGQNPGDGITGSSNGWVDAQFDLSQFVGQKINLRFNYWTDVAAAYPGFYVDDINVTADGATLLSDGAENTASPFTLDGFKQDQGKVYTENYYLLEWRNWAAADEALAHIARGHSLMAYDPGLVIWYVDNKYGDNIEGAHPGNGFLNVVDAHQSPAFWTDGTLASNRYQVKDAAFSLNKTGDMFLDYTGIVDRNLVEDAQAPVGVFNDASGYYNPEYPYIGVQLPQNGLKVHVVGQAKDMSVGSIHLQK